MQIKYRQYPHPVLSFFSDDLVNCAFQTTLKSTITKTAYKFEAICKTSSRDLIKLIKSKKAYYAFHVECATTRYRRIFRSFENQFSFEIPAEELDGRVQVCSFILAAQDLPNYKNRNFHPDYGNMSFKVRKGDVLAVDREKVFDAEKEIDPLKRIPSIFSVCPDESDDAPPFDIDASDDKVRIKLSKENFERYKMLKLNQNLHTILASLLVIPALVSLLELIKVNSAQLDEYDERRWFRVLVRKLKDIGIDIENPHSFSDSSVAVAQKIIGEPLTSSLKILEEYESEGSNSED